MSSGSAPHPIRILLVDDSPLIRLGLRSALEDFSDIAIVGEASNGSTALTAVKQHHPDVVLLDLHLPDKSGLQVCRELNLLQPAPRVLVLTSSSDERNVHAAMAAGALGYLLKENDGNALAAALRKVSTGQAVLDPLLSEQLFNLIRHRGEPTAAEKLAVLSPQERRIVALLASGLTNKEIGSQLELTEKTVKNYLATVFTKLNISRRSQAAALHAESNNQVRSIN